MGGTLSILSIVAFPSPNIAVFAKGGNYLRRAQLPRLAREREQVLLRALGTPDPGEAVLKEAAVEIPPHLLVDEAAPAPCLGRIE